jgi:predicted site-specific integrase-resolvase
MNYSTVQAAKVLKIGYATLHRWIASGRFKPPKLRKVGGLSVRLWTRADIRRARKYKAKFYFRNRRPKKKAQALPTLPEGHLSDRQP